MPIRAETRFYFFAPNNRGGEAVFAVDARGCGGIFFSGIGYVEAVHRLSQHGWGPRTVILRQPSREQLMQTWDRLRGRFPLSRSPSYQITLQEVCVP